MFVDRSKRLDVRHPLYHQRLAGLLGVLAHLLHHGSPVLRREVLQVSGRGQHQAASERGARQVGVFPEELLLGQLQDNI